ncbi:hypothetical protein [Alienimonas californiensis]|uniref:hypothetical protein n=1 Tax=Alienimonas californiensis TaxID=2527989 RepID=UPI0011A688F7|nr:hypothetical protein [Alienimonas californiensis]
MTLSIVVALLGIAGGIMTAVDPSTRRVWALSAAEVGYGVFDVWGDDAAPTPDIRPVDEDAMAAAIAAAWPGGAEVTVEIDQPSTLQPLPFRHEDVDSPEFRAFAEDLRRVLGGSIPEDPFELCDAVRRLAPHGVPAEDPGSHPALCLLAAEGDGPLLCHHFAALTAHALLAVGYDARVLGLSADGTVFEHAVVEYCDPAARRWVLLDPDFNLAYRRAADWSGDDAGEWLSARDLHTAAADLAGRGLDAGDATVVRRETGIEAVVLGRAGGALRTSHVRGGPADAGRKSLTSLYRTVFYSARNDQLSNWLPPGHPDAVRQYVLWDGPSGKLPPACPEGTRLSAAGLERLYGPVGAVVLRQWGLMRGSSLGSSPGTKLNLQFALAGIGLEPLHAADTAGDIIAAVNGQIVWPLHLGRNVLTVEGRRPPDRLNAAVQLRVTVRPALHSPAKPPAP